jgi:16S rRNA C967 or C1407 C5-methylase (RsmB/RsmF family)
MGVSNTVLYRMDASNFSNFGIKVDKILLDAPCTGEGLIPFDRKRKTSRKYEDILFCSNIQVKLLEEAIKCVKNDGIIVYSTCSIAPEENELVIDRFLKNENLKILDLGLDFGDPGLTEFFGNKVDQSLIKARRFYPHKTGTQGFFICKLKKWGRD